MHSDVFTMTCFKPGMMIDTYVLNILMFVQLNLALIQGHWSSGKQNLCARYATKLSISMNGIYCTVETCSCDEPDTHFITSI